VCQATVFLDGKEILQDVTLVEILPEGVRVKVFFDEPIVLPAAVRRVDLLKHQVILETVPKGAGDHERFRETAHNSHPLDGP
jgi:predicted RNA-binding protein